MQLALIRPVVLQLSSVPDNGINPNTAIYHCDAPFFCLLLRTVSDTTDVKKAWSQGHELGPMYGLTHTQMRLNCTCMKMMLGPQYKSLLSLTEIYFLFDTSGEVILFSRYHTSHHKCMCHVVYHTSHNNGKNVCHMHDHASVTR